MLLYAFALFGVRGATLIDALLGTGSRTVWIGFLCLMAVALAACGGDDDPTAAPTPEPTALAAPVSTPTGTPPPTPIGTPPPTQTRPPTPERTMVAVTPAPTRAPATPSPTPDGDGAAVEVPFELDSDTTWKEIFDQLSESEQSCIRSKLGEEALGSLLEQSGMPVDDLQQIDPSVIECLDKETASDLILSIIVGQMGGLSEEGETCLRELLENTDVARVAAGSQPDASTADLEMAFEFGFALLGCTAGDLLTGDITSGSVGSLEQSDESLLWSYLTGDWVVNKPVVVDGVVYAGSNDFNVYALDADTGGLLWSFDTGSAIRTTPTVAGGVVYAVSNDARLHALDASTGNLLWDRAIIDTVQYPPVVSNGTVYIGAESDGNHRLHALDAESGAPIWVAGPPLSFAGAAPVVAGNRVYVQGGFDELQALDAGTGEVLWSYSPSRHGESIPMVTGGVVYLTSVTKAHALDEATGKEIWSYDTDRYPARDFPALVVDGHYYFSPDDHVYALDVKTGDPVWTYVLDGMATTAPYVADGMVFVGSEKPRFYALDAASGDLVWSRDTEGWMLESPTVSGGVLYGESNDGNLRALDASTGETLWQFQKGYFWESMSYVIDNGVIYLGSLDGRVYALTAQVSP